MHPKDAPHLSEWATAAEVAQRLGVTRQTVNRMFWSGMFSTLHQFGVPDANTFCISRKELEKFAKERDKKQKVRVSD